jgi:glycosyl transferase family 2
VAERLTVLVAARDEEQTIAEAVHALRRAFPHADVVVADDGSRDGTVSAAERAGAKVLRFARLGKGQALTEAERRVGPGPLLLCDADARGDLTPLVEADADVSVAVFRRPRGGGFGIAKGIARAIVRNRTGFEPREPLSGQRALSAAARAVCFPLAPGFGCETRMTLDALEAGLDYDELELDLRHRATGRDVTGFLHRGRQLLHILLAAGPLAVNHRGLRLPVVGWLVGARRSPAVAAVAALGLADDLWSGPERGARAHLAHGRTTGMLKLLGIPAVGLLATRRVSGALLVGLAANALNQLDTRPGRALKAYLAGALVLDAPVGVAVLLAPYDLREMAMLGDAGANALGAMLGLSSVSRLTGKRRWLAIGGLAGLNLLGELRSLSDVIERTPVLKTLDSLGRRA